MNRSNDGCTRSRPLPARVGLMLAGMVLALSACGGGDDDGNTGGGGGGATPTYAVGGTVTGLAGTGLVLQNNGGDDLGAAASGGFVFAGKLASGAAYAVTVKTQPTNPAQTCTVGNGSGTIAAADVMDVAVACTLIPVGGGGGGGGGGGPGGGDPTGTYYTGNFAFVGSYDQGRGSYVGEAQLRFNFEGDFPNERRYVLAGASAVFTKWEDDGTNDVCVLTADSNTPMSSAGYLIFNTAQAGYVITGGLLVFQATSACTRKSDGNVTVSPAIMQVFVVSTGAAGDALYLPVSGDGSVIDGSRMYVGAQSVLTQQNQWHLERHAP